MKVPRSLAGLLCAACVVVSPVHAQTYPGKPIKVIVGYAAGGAVDIVARTVGQQLAISLGQPVIVDNRPGAATNIAVKALIESPADGYTLLLAANALAANPSLFQPPPFDLARDIAPVSLVGSVPVVIAVSAASGLTTIAQLVESAKARPQSITYASPGNGSTPHLAFELFERAAAVSLTHVPYKGGAPAITDVIGGHVQVIAVNALEVQPQVKGGKLRVLAVLSRNRSPIWPEVPTIAESGYPGFEASVWYGFVAPAATPKPVIARLHAEVQKALASTDVRERLAAAGGEVIPASTEQFAAMLESERLRYAKLIREANIKPD
ncbi:MAG: tripartite tricarboxylate transporter substrate binding protein [Burkholderiales bacterium]|nr:tripartite tricarboxylate transporter substrate binding protein [Burkholderiales bacterium]